MPVCLASSALIYNLSAKYCSKNHLVVKELIYNKDTLEITIHLSGFSNPVTLRVGSFAIKDCGDAYTIISGLPDKYVLFKNSTLLNRKLVEYLGNLKFQDRDVESLLLKNGRLINFSCPFVGFPPETLDLAARRQILSEQESLENLSPSEIHRKMLDIPDANVNDYILTVQSRLDGNESDQISEVRDFLSQILASEKVSEALDLLTSKYHVKKLGHLKGFKGVEFDLAVKSLDLTDTEVTQLRERISNIK